MNARQRRKHRRRWKRFVLKPPATPLGTMWHDTSSNTIKRWDGSRWIVTENLIACDCKVVLTRVDQCPSA